MRGHLFDVTSIVRVSLRLIGTFSLLLSASHLCAADTTAVIEEFFVKDLKVILKKSTANETISAQLFIRGGSLNLTEANQGIEPMIFNSVTLDDKKYLQKGWQKVLSGTGGQIGTSYTRDYTVVILRCIRQYFDELWDVFADYVMNTRLYDERVEVARGQMLTRLKQRKDAPDAHIFNLAETMFYKNHPSQRDPTGTEESIRKITMRQMNRYLDSHFVKSRMFLVVVGNCNAEDLQDKVKNTFAKLSNGKYEPIMPAPVKHATPAFWIEEKELATNYILGLFSAPSLASPDYYPMTVAIEILNARLFGEIRTKRNLSYAPYAFLGNNAANYGGIYATSGEPDSTISVMLAEIRRLKTEPVAEKVLRDNIKMYLTRYYLSNETNLSQGEFLARLELSGLGWREIENTVGRLRNVTPEQVQLAANRYFKNIQFVYLGDPKAIDTMLLTSM